MSFKKALLDNLAYTDNGALSLSTTNSARVNLFFKLTRNAYNNESFTNLIDESLKEDTLDTLKIIFHGRDSRGGKGDRQTFIEAMKYIFTVNPDIFYKNIEHVPFYGRYQDWFEILYALRYAVHYNTIRDKIVELVCEKLEEDKLNMINGESVSLLAKWIPSEQKKWNKNTSIYDYICNKLYKTDYPTSYHYRLLRKNYISPLRSYINIVETYMCNNKWDDIDFSKVPSVAMHNLKKAFVRHTPDKFVNWLSDVKKGKSKINTSQLYPHTIVHEIFKNNENSEILEVQWNDIVKNTQKLGKFSKSLVLCDVSGSMEGTPMDVCIALGLLISSITDEPFRNLIITFSAEPTFFNVPDVPLYDKIEHIRNMPWGMNTDLNKVFDLILSRAQKYNILKQDMPETLYIFSDMQFDIATNSNCTTAMENIEIKYREAGYLVPKIIFWNLASIGSDFPVEFNTLNVALVSGFSQSILKNILECTDMTPYNIMRQTIDNPRYDIITI